MYKHESASDLAVKLCERLGIHYHMGNGNSTVDGKPYDFNAEPFEVDVYSATIQIAPDITNTRDTIGYVSVETQYTGLTPIYSFVNSISYRFNSNDAEPLTAA